MPIFLSLLLLSGPHGTPGEPERPSVRRVPSADGTQIVYETAGSREPALIFIHGGFADRSFWANQISAFSEKHRVIALDLAGHGVSGDGRQKWTIQAFGEDVRAALRKENIRRAIVLGNSLGGPVALEVARLEPDRVICVFGIDTFHDLSTEPPASFFEQRAAGFRKDFTGTMRQMVRALFHPDAEPALVSRVEKIMLDNSPEMAAAMMELLPTWHFAEILRDLKTPIRCINGDLYPTDVAKNRSVYPDFDAAILPHIGHYPMLENHSLFNQTLESILQKLPKKSSNNK